MGVAFLARANWPQRPVRAIDKWILSADLGHASIPPRYARCITASCPWTSGLQTSAGSRDAKSARRILTCDVYCVCRSV
jgi:hypothetical protein